MSCHMENIKKSTLLIVAGFFHLSGVSPGATGADMALCMFASC